MEQQIIPAADRHRGQKAVLCANIWMPSFNLIMMGPIMMLFANDVLKFQAVTIASIIGFAPLLIILRFPFLKLIRRVGLKRSIFFTDCVYLLTVVILMLLPLEYLGFTTFMLLILLYKMAQVMGPMTVWQPLLRDITTNKDRGRFFANMRFTFSVVTLAVSAAMTFLIGDEISRAEYNILLMISVFGIANRMYWIRRIPEQQHETADIKESKSLIDIVKESQLLRRPLFIVMLTTLAAMPMFIVYLRQCLYVPTNVVSAFIFMGALGTVVSMILWGRIADAIGFKPMLIGLIILTVLLSPALLLITPMDAETFTWLHMNNAEMVSISVLMLYSFIGGAMAAGSGIAATSIQHAHTKSRYALEEMAVFSVLVVAAQSASAFISGWVIESWTLGDNIHVIFDDALQWDWTKLYIIVIANACNIAALILLLKLPNIRPHFGLSDFFHSMFAQPLRTMYRGRFRYDDDERLRINTARLLAQNQNPIAIDPLLELLDDPSYDVRCEAITALARSQSPMAGERFIELLEDPERRQLWDRIAWALGELKWTDAGTILQQRVQDEDLAFRIRAMSARALGKMEDVSAAPILAALLENERESLHFRSSCCCALFHLKAHQYADILFNEINLLRDRYDRYEVLALACECLELESLWLISAKAHMTTYDMLDRDIQFRSRGWQLQHKQIIELFHTKEHLRVAETFEKRLNGVTEDAGSAEGLSSETIFMLRALTQCIAGADRWGPNLTLACAWLLHYADET
ncbi:MAG: MFS transporter [Planctomycetes bacterium]|nr:MFS transporter [Planctomycetota bacterium]